MRKISLFLSTFLLLQTGWAAIPKAQKEQLLEVHKKLSSLNSMSIPFKQQLWSPLRRRVKASDGKLALNTNGAFKWTVQGKFSEVYANNLKVFWIYNEATRHAQCLHPSKVRKRLQFMDILYNIGKLEENYTVSLWKGGKKQKKSKLEILNPNPPSTPFTSLSLRLVPKNSAIRRSVKEAYLVLNLKNKSIHEVRTVAPDGNRSRIVFQPPKPLKPDSSSFSFTPPKGTAEDCHL